MPLSNILLIYYRIPRSIAIPILERTLLLMLHLLLTFGLAAPHHLVNRPANTGLRRQV